VIRAYVYGVLVALDQLANSLIPGGYPDETLSSRMGRKIKRYRTGQTSRRPIESEMVCAILDALDREHCATSIEETPEGETAARHLGRVIRELPPGHTLWVKVPQ
jgi:hypothetical protein